MLFNRSAHSAGPYSFCALKTTFGVILFAYFTLLHFSKNIGNRCIKGCGKLTFLIEKPTLGVPGSIDCAIVGDF